MTPNVPPLKPCASSSTARSGKTTKRKPPWTRKFAHRSDLNASGLTLPDGSGRPLRLRLTRKEQISVRIDDATATSQSHATPQSPKFGGNQLAPLSGPNEVV